MPSRLTNYIRALGTCPNMSTTSKLGIALTLVALAVAIAWAAVGVSTSTLVLAGLVVAVVLALRSNGPAAHRLRTLAGTWRCWPFAIGRGVKRFGVPVGRLLGTAGLPLGFRLGVVVLGPLVIWIQLTRHMPTWLALVVVLAGLGWLGRTPSADNAAWWSHGRLVTAFVQAGVLPRLREGQPPYSLRYRGAVRHTEHGSHVTVDLPGGVALPDVIARRDRLASALGVPAAKLLLSQRPEDPAGTVRLYVGAPRSVVITPAEVGSVALTFSNNPVRIGVDPMGQPVKLETAEHNVLLAGQPGSGKTSVARIVLAHYVLDPAARVFLLDGKGSRVDYDAARPLCERFVYGTDEDAVTEVEAMLREVLAIVQTRNSSGSDTAPGGVLVLLEELQDVRAGADKAGRERLDNLLGRIMRMGRAVGVTVLISTQRPSVEDVPSGVRNLVSQRLALMLRNPADAALVLGLTPDLPMPTRRGEALLTTPTGTTSVDLDLLDQTAWTDLCARAAHARHTTLALTAEAPTDQHAGENEPVAAEPLAAAMPVDPLLAEVLTLLRDGNPRGMGATDLYDQLPAWLRPSGPAALGKVLAGHPDLVRPGHAKDVGRVWRAVDHPSTTRRPAVDPLAPSTATPVDLGKVDGSQRQDPPIPALPAQPLSPSTSTFQDAR